ncbi:Protein of uncharacterised function (DUF1120) [Yersinia enterocolitica]|uniref:DUF1120 domain-containing protein n=1 Tax=Yersinia mollaretii TaxID=33060 RepID=UPI0005DC82C4|nr:DUF1120 domain-containing protein [Yersinia mollaretii]CNK97188.1 Protein of uncharacterised function (DUF1120) [Yersinia enterocolitica]
MKLHTLSAALLLICGSAAQAATTADISVGGTVKPTSCTLTMNGATDAVVDYGIIDPNTLSADAYTPLAVKTIPLRIECDAATSLSLDAIDNKGSTNTLTGNVDTSAASGYSTADTDYLFGLGSNGSGGIGAYSLALEHASLKVDGNAASFAYSSSNGSSWGHYPDAGNGTFGKGSRGTAPYWATWVANATSKVPLVGSTFEGNLKVMAIIDKKSNLNIQNDVTLNGSATVEIHYL